MREIGGYIELDNIKGQHYHSEALRLNCGRSCLTYLIKAKNIRKLYIPLYLCDTVKQCCETNGIEVFYYKINYKFSPQIDYFESDSYLYLVNYFGLLTKKEINSLVKKYKRIIVDNSQAFFCDPVPEADTIYVARKYLGVADGAYLYTDCILDDEIPVDSTCDRMSFILGRYEKEASLYYNEYVENNAFFDEMILKRMSRISDNLLNGFDYEMIRKRRTDNYKFLNKKLKENNKLKTPKVIDGAFGYPLLVENGKEIKKELIDKKIYVPTLWPEVINNCEKKSIESNLAEKLVILPVDQRYEINDMEYIANEVLKCLG